jgi:hypothetical protein
VYFSITLLCLGSSIVFSDHDESSNNYGHYEWGSWSNSNTYVGIRYTDEWDKHASDFEWPFEAHTSVKTIRKNIPAILYSYASWKCTARIECNSNFYKGYYSVVAEIIVDGEVEDIGYGNYDPNVEGAPKFTGKHKDKAKAYHSDTNTGPDIFPHPSDTASDCAAGGNISGKAYDMNDTAYLEAVSRIPW